MDDIWIRTNINFGLPFKTFLLPIRSEYGNSLYNVYRKAAIGKDKQHDEQWALRTVAAFIEAILVRLRPSLAGGLSVISISMSKYGGWWEFTVTHPSFDRVPFGHSEPRERLELCPVCNKPLSIDVACIAGGVDGPVIEVCSMTCVDIHSSHRR